MADYDMTHTGAQLDKMIDNALDKRTGGVVNGDIVSTTLISAPKAVTDILETVDGLALVDIKMLADANIVNIANNTIPTEDPLIAGRIWNDAGTLKVSTGA